MGMQLDYERPPRFIAVRADANEDDGFPHVDFAILEDGRPITAPGIAQSPQDIKAEES